MTTATKRLRVGIIGASPKGGWGTDSHARAIQNIGTTELLAVCTAHEDTARASAQKLGVELAYHDHKEMLANRDIDAVAIVVRVPQHYQITLDAINTGKHVYTEWPLVLSSKEAQTLVDAAKKAGVHTRAGFQRRNHPAHMRLKELVAEGFVGKVLAVNFNMHGSGVLTNTSDRSWRGDRTLGTNTMTVGFGHEIDAVLSAVGEVTEVSGIVSTQVKQWYETDTKRYIDVTAADNIIMNGRLANGGVLNAHLGSQPYHGGPYRLEVYGTEGTLLMTPIGAAAGSYANGWASTYQIMGGKKDDKGLVEQPIPDRLRWAPSTLQGGAYLVGQMWAQFAESIRTGKDIEPTFETALRRHKLLEALQRASDTGQAQKL